MIQPDAVQLISNRYGIEKKDADAWMKVTEWESTNEIHPEVIQEVQKTLKELGVIHKQKDLDEFCMSL